MRLELQANAKINLGLRILGKRSDGYHDLITLFQRVSLADRVSLEPISSDIKYLGPNLTVDPKDNLCVRAGLAFQEAFGSNRGVEINLEKMIPVGAGLGGGSSDAAAVLRGMARLYGVDTGSEELRQIAVQVGSDVPFFLSDYSAAIGEGMGEKLTSILGLDQHVFVTLLWPGFSISTKWAYKSADKSLTFRKKNSKIIVRQFCSYRDGIPTAELINDFEGPVFAAHPELARARDELLQRGAETAGLCGSGSALFGIFDGEAEAGAAARGWRSPWLSFVCRPI